VRPKKLRGKADASMPEADAGRAQNGGIVDDPKNNRRRMNEVEMDAAPCGRAGAMERLQKFEDGSRNAEFSPAFKIWSPRSPLTPASPRGEGEVAPAWLQVPLSYFCRSGRIVNTS